MDQPVYLNTNFPKHPCLLKSKLLKLMNSSRLSETKKQNLPHYTCRLRDALYSGLEYELGTISGRHASVVDQAPEAQWYFSEALGCAVRLFVYYFNQRQLHQRRYPNYRFHNTDFVYSPYEPLPEHILTLKPATLMFEQAVAAPLAALTALQGLRDNGNIQPAQQALIQSASGGVGTFAIHIAKALGRKSQRCAVRGIGKWCARLGQTMPSITGGKISPKMVNAKI